LIINVGNPMALNRVPEFRRVRLRTTPWYKHAPYTRRVELPTLFVKCHEALGARLSPLACSLKPVFLS
jgi:hypothetical protein